MCIILHAPASFLFLFPCGHVTLLAFLMIIYLRIEIQAEVVFPLKIFLPLHPSLRGRVSFLPFLGLFSPSANNFFVQTLWHCFKHQGYNDEPYKVPAFRKLMF